MSFLKNMITGGEGHAVAQNAHLAELLLRTLGSADKRQQVLQSLQKVMRRGMSFQRMDDDQLADEFDALDRVAQLNMLSIAMKEIGIFWKDEPWMPIRNPMFHSMDARDVEVNAWRFKRKHGLTVTILAEPMNLGQWVKEGRLVRKSSTAGGRLSQNDSQGFGPGA